MSRLERVKIGDEIKFSEDYLDFWYNEAFSMCARAEGIRSDADAKDYLIRKIMSLGYPYKAVIIGPRLDDTGGGMPGHKVKIILPHGLVDETIVGVGNFSLYRKKKRRKS